MTEPKRFTELQRTRGILFYQLGARTACPARRKLLERTANYKEIAWPSWIACVRSEGLFTHCCKLQLPIAYSPKYARRTSGLSSSDFASPLKVINPLSIT